MSNQLREDSRASSHAEVGVNYLLNNKSKALNIENMSFECAIAFFHE